jgi:phosphatidate cytidylyltransferase
MRRSDLSTSFPASSSSMFGMYYVGATMSCLPLLQRKGWFPVIFTFFAVWAGDIVAMYTGKTIGKHKMSPRISPNKTWEGAIGSVVGSLGACWLLAHFAPRINVAVHGSKPLVTQNLWFVIVGAILLNIAAQLGDLVESLIKRGANVKDSGTMLPGHGGILDRIDALLFAAPVALVLFEFVR